jgi:hypothetical protein
MFLRIKIFIQKTFINENKYKHIFVFTNIREIFEYIKKLEGSTISPMPKGRD